MQAVLVAVHADAELAGISRCLKNTDAGAAGRVIDNVSAAVELRLGQLTTLDRVVPGRAGGAGHVFEDFGVGLAAMTPCL